MAGVTTPRRLSYGALAAGIGGILLIVSLFVDWAGSGSFGVNGWKAFKFDDVVLFVLALLAIAFAALELTAARVNLPFGRARALTIVGIVASTLVLSVLVESSHTKFGIWLAAISALAILAGGILAERAPQLGLDLGRTGAGAGPAAPGYPPQPGPAQPVAPPGGYGQPQPPPAAGPPPGATAVGQVQPEPAQPPPVEPPTQPLPPEPAAPAAAAADWYPDPSGQKRLRYWDGTQWTDHTAD